MSQVYKVEQIKKPLENYRDIDAFKIYVSDLGLLCAKKDLAANDILYMVEEINDFKGGMAENYVNVQLSINGYHTYYWKSERGAEIDFIIQRDGQLIPIEVKSADNTRAKSLKVYMDTYKPAYAIKLSAKNFGFENNKKTVPLYAAFCIWNQYCNSNAHRKCGRYFFLVFFMPKIPVNLEKGGKSRLLFKIKMLWLVVWG